MNTNLTVQVISLVLLSLSILFGLGRWRHLNLVDLYFLIVIIFFGLYGFIDALLNDLKFYDPVVFAFIITWIILLAIITWAIWHIFPAKNIQALNLRYLFFLCERTDGSVILIIFGCILALTIISFYKFGVISRINFAELEQFNIVLPYWFTSTKGFVKSSLLCVFIASVAKSAVKMKWKRVFWTSVAILAFALTATYGRRDALILVFLFIIFKFIRSKKNLLIAKNIILVLVSILLMFGFSNLFQNTRRMLSSSAGSLRSLASGKNLINYTLDADATLSNLRNRMVMWKFNYLLFINQEKAYKVVPYGMCLVKSFENTVPKILWPRKKDYDLDYEIASLYKFQLDDYPSNNFASAQADFGYLSIIILPLQMVILFFFLSTLIIYRKRNPTFCVLVIGFSLQYLLNIEQSLTDYFLLLRSIIIIFVSHGILTFIIKSTKKFGPNHPDIFKKLVGY